MAARERRLKQKTKPACATSGRAAEKKRIIERIRECDVLKSLVFNLP